MRAYSTRINKYTMEEECACVQCVAFCETSFIICTKERSKKKRDV